MTLALTGEDGNVRGIVCPLLFNPEQRTVWLFLFVSLVVPPEFCAFLSVLAANSGSVGCPQTRVASWLEDLGREQDFADVPQFQISHLRADKWDVCPRIPVRPGRRCKPS